LETAITDGTVGTDLTDGTPGTTEDLIHSMVDTDGVILLQEIHGHLTHMLVLHLGAVVLTTRVSTTITQEEITTMVQETLQEEIHLQERLKRLEILEEAT